MYLTANAAKMCQLAVLLYLKMGRTGRAPLMLDVSAVKHERFSNLAKAL